ncbi:MUC1-Extracellular alpha-14-glucan glucosidase [Fusarium acutatum]|uniref:MUC1-Extracellular alpha-14-glucan glucosidase n=1 Tax=Fusarium acutatum TaxID=78861 RepID=A0A8H4NL90_9HYPO|nr:MUC1-Extracellular alpha-14-glucan glucosidase [Fusarium acutatum]
MTTGVGSKTTSAGQSTTTKATKTSETTKSIETTKATEIIETTKNQFSTSLTTPISIPVYTKPVSYTKVIPTETVTTITYVTACPTNSASLTTTYVPVTITYEPCGCDHQTYPPVQMTTTTMSCHACGSHGENTVTLTMPAAACEAPSGSHRHKAGHGNAQTTAKSHSYVQPGHDNGHSPVPSLTQGKPQPGYENGKPYVSVHDSPQPTHNNGSYHPPAQPTASASKPSVVVLPSASAPNKGQEAAPTTLATEALVTGEGQAAKSAQGLYPTQPAEAPSTSVVASGANKNQLMVWT